MAGIEDVHLEALDDMNSAVKMLVPSPEEQAADLLVSSRLVQISDDVTLQGPMVPPSLDDFVGNYIVSPGRGFPISSFSIEREDVLSGKEMR